QTYRDLAKGEQTAAQLEANLTVLESKLEAMLQALEGRAQDENQNEKQKGGDAQRAVPGKDMTK
ncbi:hypothetical protein E4U43_000696, partial [Claviceps pusilla]